MQINIKYNLKKIIYFFKENIENFFSKRYTNIHLITDGASWAVDQTTEDISKFFKQFNSNTKISLFPPKKQYVYYSDQYSILKGKFYKRQNIVCLDYQHGQIKYIKNNRKLLSFVIKHQSKIKLIRVTNSFFREYLIKKGIKKNKIIQIPITIDTQKFKPLKNKKYYKQKFKLPEDKILIGSFHKDGNGWGQGNEPKLIKGPDTLVKTLIDLNKKIGLKKICVVLTSPARGYVKKQLRKNNIEFKHFYPLEDFEIPLLFNCLDIYLIASRDEGGPRGLFEAMACGIPVISTLVGHAHDYIKNGHNGFRSPIEDFESLSSNILKVIRNKNLKEKIIKNSIKTAQLNNFKSHLKYWKNFYNQL